MYKCTWEGTILHTAQHYNKINCPIASINLGTLGFLTTTTKNNTELLLESLLNNNYHVTTHHLLNIELSSQKKSYLALNEVVLSRYNSSRMVSIRAYADGKEISPRRCRNNVDRATCTVQMPDARRLSRSTGSYGQRHSSFV